MWGRWWLATVLLGMAALKAQDVPGIQDSDLTLLLGTEARFQLGGQDGRWEARALMLYQRDSSLQTYASTIGGVEVVYNTPTAGYFSAQAFYLSLRNARAGGLFRVEWQKVWLAQRMAPLIRVTQERLHIVDLPSSQEILRNYRTRLRLGFIPELTPRLRFIALGEWFVYQDFGWSEEYRSITGLSYSLTSAVRLTAAHLGRLRTYEEARLRWQHTIYFGVTYSGVVSEHDTPTWEGG